MDPPASYTPPERRHDLQRDGNAMQSGRRHETDRRRFGLLCALAYIALAWAVRFDMQLGDQMASLLYPLDTFSMYAGPPGEYVSHPLIRDQDGRVHRITSYRAFACTEAVARPAARCVNNTGYAYLYDDLARYIEGHPGPGAADVELIYRTWQVRAGAAPTPVSDCVIAHCRASR